MLAKFSRIDVAEFIFSVIFEYLVTLWTNYSADFRQISTFPRNFTQFIQNLTNLIDYIVIDRLEHLAKEKFRH